MRNMKRSFIVTVNRNIGERIVATGMMVTGISKEAVRVDISSRFNNIVSIEIERFVDIH